MADVSNDRLNCNHTNFDDLPVCDWKPDECDCDHWQDGARFEQIRGGAFVPSYEGAVRHEAHRLLTQPYYRDRAILADSLKRILAQIDSSSLRVKRDYALLLMVSREVFGPAR